MDYYWKLVLWDGEEIRVKPQAVDAVKAKLATGSGHIITTSRTFAVKDIRSFEQTAEKYNNGVKVISDPQIRKEALSAFDTGPDNDKPIPAQAVKKMVSRKEYQSFYSKSPGYVLLGDNGSSVEVGFIVPSHLIDPSRVTVCNEKESSIVLTRNAQV